MRALRLFEIDKSTIDIYSITSFPTSSYVAQVSHRKTFADRYPHKIFEQISATSTS